MKNDPKLIMTFKVLLLEQFIVTIFIESFEAKAAKKIKPTQKPERNTHLKNVPVLTFKPLLTVCNASSMCFIVKAAVRKITFMITA